MAASKKTKDKKATVLHEQPPAKRGKTSPIRKQAEVWHLTDFRELFELPDDLRKNRPGPLSYTKSFVSLTALSKEAEIKHFERMQHLQSYPDRHLLRSMFEDAKNWTARKTLRFRGFFVTAEGKPARNEYLAAQWRVDVADVEKVMPIFAEVGLIELVSLTKMLRDKASTRSKKKSKKTSKRICPDRSGQKRTHPDRTGRKRTALYKEKSIKVKNKTNSKKEANANALANGKSKRKYDKRQKRIRETSHLVEGKNQKETEIKITTTESPATSPPIMPKASDLGGSRVIPFKAPLGSVKDTRLKSCERLGDIAKRTLIKCNPQAQQFAREIYQALRFPWDFEHRLAKRELGSFAHQWLKAETSGIPPPKLTLLWARAIQEARHVAKYKKSCERPGAVWCKIFTDMLDKRLAERKTTAVNE